MTDLIGSLRELAADRCALAGALFLEVVPNLTLPVAQIGDLIVQLS